MYVNVPWTDNNTTYTAGTGLSLSGTAFSTAKHVFRGYSRDEIGTSPNFDTIDINGLFEVRSSSETTGESGIKPFDSFGPMLSFKYSNTMFQMAATRSGSLHWRAIQAVNPSLAGVNWQTCLDSKNYADYTVKKDGTGASGTWGINITGNAASLSGTLAVNKGGTGATDAATARTNLGITPANIGAVSKAGDTMTGTLILIPTGSSSEGGEILLAAPGGSTAKAGTYIDNYNSTFRIFGYPSADGTTKTGSGTPLVVDPYAKTITGGYTITGTLNGNASSADKVNKSLTIQANGSSLGSFDGSSAKTFNITASSIGAQASLGYTPIRQGGGTDQGTNTVKIGWATNGSGLKCTVDNTDLGYIYTSNTSVGKNIIDAIYPVGSIYMSTNSTSPATLFGKGTWERIQDTFLLAAGSSYSAGSTGGEVTHTLTTDEMPAHAHTPSNSAYEFGTYQGGLNNSNIARKAVYENSSGQLRVIAQDNNKYDQLNTHGSTSTVGAGAAHNNMPPYLTVYMWKRTA